MRSTISIRDLEVSCLIGILKPERISPQRITVDLDLVFDGRRAALSDNISATHDYSAISQQVAFVLEAGEFLLVESAAHVLARLLLLPPTDDRPPVEEVTVRISKGEALPGSAVASVTVKAAAEEQSYRREEKAWGFVHVIEETRSMGLYRLSLEAGGRLPRHHHQVMRESEMVVDDGLVGHFNGSEPRRLTPCERFAWPHGEVHGYHNPTDTTRSLLCVDLPPFDPDDEIEV